MNEQPLPHYCIRCGQEFTPAGPEAVLCPNCGGPPEDRPAQPQGIPVAPPEAGIHTLFVEAEPPGPISTVITGPPEALAPSPPGKGVGGEGRHFTTETDVPADWQVGDTLLDLYEVTDTLGEGGMGRVYKVYHKGWKVDLAVKSPKPDIFAKAGGQENFVHEAETWVNLGLHPHIVSCYYVRTLGGIPRVFAEYVEGGSLEEWIQTRQLYAGGHEAALARILDIATQFAWGLDYAHEPKPRPGQEEPEPGLVHQDVKPANVMMTPDGIAKVTDFGLAKARALGGGRSLLVSTGGMTPAYCSPEQAAGLPLSRKTDIWSWGLSILEMFTGQVTWLAGQLAGEVLALYLETEPPNPAIPPMPPALADLLRQCFQVEPEARPRDMQAVATSLQEIYRQEVGQPYPREAPRPAEALADSLNNRAVSLLDLGKAGEAEQLWEETLKADPHHPEASYNYGVRRWRRGELTDDVLVQDLEVVEASHSDSWQAKYMLALVHLERGDVDAATVLLKDVVQQALGEPEMQAALNLARSGEMVGNHFPRTFEGHIGPVNSVSLSADGRWALSGSADKTVRFWEVATGRCVHTFEGHTEPVNAVCLSADGRWALSGSGSSIARTKYRSRTTRISTDNTVRLWEVVTGRCLRIFQGHTEAVTSVSLSADGRWALSGSADKTVRLWEVTTGGCLRIFLRHTGAVNSVSLSADGRLALSGAKLRTDLPTSDTLCLWDVTTYQCLHTFEGHTYDVISACLSADGRWALSGSLDQPLRLWEVATGRCVSIFQGHPGGVTSINLSANGHWAASGSTDKTLRLWEMATGRCLRTFEGHTAEVTSISLSADGRFVLSGSKDKTLRLWQAPGESLEVCLPRLSRLWSHAQLSEVETRANKLLQQAEEALGQNRFAAALDLVQAARQVSGYERAPQAMQVWTRLSYFCRRVGLQAAWQSKLFEGHTEEVTSVCLSADGRLALSGGFDKTLRLWETATGRCLRIFQGHTDGVTSVSLSSDGRFALSGSGDKTLRLWEVATGHCLRTFEGHTNVVRSVCFSPDGRFALSGSYDQTLRLWEVATGHCLRVFKGSTDPRSVSLSANGRLALSKGYDEPMRLWEVDTGRCLRTFEKDRLGLGVGFLSADACWALSERFNVLQLWEVATGRCLRSFDEGHTDGVTAICMSLDGRFALSGSSDNTLRLWEVATGKCLWVFQEHTNEVTSACLSADGHWALSGSDDQTVRLWELDWELEAHDPADWDEEALPHLKTFLALHTPRRHGLFRRALPSWTEEEFEGLIRQLQYVGYGWLQPEGVQRKLAELAGLRR